MAVWICLLGGLTVATPFSPAQPSSGKTTGAASTTLVELLGVRVIKPTPVLVEQLGLPNDRGLLIEYVRPHSAAEKSGLKLHDILLELDGKPLSSNVNEFSAALAAIKPNTPVTAVVVRKGRPETLKAFSRPPDKGE